MERHFYLGLTILILLLALCLGTAIGIAAIHKPSEANLTQAADLALEGNWEQATSLAENTYRRWEKYRSFTASLADHDPMDTAECLFQQILVYAETRDIPHFAACCTQLSKLLQAIYDAHILSFSNFL